MKNQYVLLQETRDRVFSKEEEGLKRILDFDLKITLRPEQWTRILEQVKRSLKKHLKSFCCTTVLPTLTLRSFWWS